MMIDTTRFGTLSIEESGVITFPDGLPGFEGCRRFTLVPHQAPGSGQSSPFEWLQSLDDGSLAFLAINPNLVFPQYSPKLPTGELESIALAHDEADEPRLYTLLTVPKGDPCGITANLMAPVVVNVETRMAKQIVVAGDEYGLRHRLLPN